MKKNFTISIYKLSGVLSFALLMSFVSACTEEDNTNIAENNLVSRNLIGTIKVNGSVSIDVYLNSDRTRNSKNYGNSILAINKRLDNTVFQSPPTFDAYIEDKTIVLADMDGDGVKEISYSITNEGGGENSTKFNLVANLKSSPKLLSIKDGYVFRIEDVNSDGIPEIVHSYNDPYFSQPGGILPEIYWEDIYVLDSNRLRKLRLSGKDYGQYIKDRLQFYNSVIALKEKNSNIENIESYFDLAVKYRARFSREE